MELTQVRYFLALCDTLNFSRAAEQCHVTQPAFSRAIQRLEEELGGALLYRERALTQLTPLGREMRPHLQAMTDAADAAQALAESYRKPQGGSLRIGLGPGVGAGVIAGAVAEVLRVLPNTEVRLDDSPPGVLVESMLSDALDCALLPEDTLLPDRLNRWVLYTDTAVLLLPAGHALARRNEVGAGDLAGETVLETDFSVRLGGLRVQPYRGAAAQIADLVAAGLGLALVSSRAAVPPPLTTRAFSDPVLERRIMLTAIAGRPFAPAAANFLRLCRAQSFN
jgi:DNA-binding transcriptional LysR family regulator